MNNLRQKIKDALFNKELIKKNLNHPFAEWEEEDIEKIKTEDFYTGSDLIENITLFLEEEGLIDFTIQCKMGEDEEWLEMRIYRPVAKDYNGKIIKKDIIWEIDDCSNTSMDELIDFIVEKQEKLGKIIFTKISKPTK
jgi:hypothetical protein